MYDLGGELGLQASAGRQSRLIAMMPFSYDQLVSGEAGRAVIMPGNSRVIGGALIIEEAFNSETSDQIKVGDADDDDRYTSAVVDASSTGHTALTLTGHRYTGKDTINLTWTGAGAEPTQGSGLLVVEYVIEGRAIEIQPAVV